MNYKYSFPGKTLTADLASGRVLFSAPGQPCLPVRLTNEIFHMCLGLLRLQNCPVLLDPCCGSAYHIAIVSLINPGVVQKIIVNDASEKALSVARKNLQLLTREGLQRRHEVLQQLYASYGKESHRTAITSAKRLLRRLNGSTGPDLTIALGNALHKEHVAATCKRDLANIVFTDVPYGKWSNWIGSYSKDDPFHALLESLKPVLAHDSIVAVFSAKGRTPAHDSFKRTKKIIVGHRQVTLLVPNSNNHGAVEYQ